MKRLLRLLLSRTSFILILLVAQIVFFFYSITLLSKFQYVHTSLYFVTVIIIAYLIYKEENPIYKLTWIIPILIFPLFGGLFYLFYKNTNISKKVMKRYQAIESSRIDRFKDISLPTLDNKIFNYLFNIGWPTYQNTKTTYLKSGPIMYEDMLISLKAAKSFIYLEFFIISPGQMWNEVLDILKQKIDQGVSVKIIFDDFGSSKLPYGYTKKLKEFGIDAYNFNPMKPHLNFQMNYRDHRKLVIIDNLIAYTGGINLADEYIDLIKPFKNWQDAGLKIQGDAVYSLYISFMNQLRFITGQTLEIDLKPKYEDNKSTSYVTPFLDAPLDEEYTAKNIYLQMINQAKESILITTPYLVLDYEMSSALKFAAKSGVKVQVIIPFVPDKRTVYMVSESYASELSKHGIDIYKYKPGFIHQKMMLVDDHEALLGSVNLDFRSLYLHFENSIYLKDDLEIKKMTSHFQDLINVSIHLKDDQKHHLFYKLIQIALKGFSSIL
ncbi:MAG: cardiolipin synthase [Acholeplasmataceae bacterium]|nr:cardiolipin synthase [Acholeplasmataceae bacterium]